jgi:hypothetical protein
VRNGEEQMKADNTDGLKRVNTEDEHPGNNFKMQEY